MVVKKSETKKARSSKKNVTTKKVTKKETAGKNFYQGVHTHIVVIVVSVIALLLSALNYSKINNIIKERKEIEKLMPEDISYKIYIGLTDKNQKRQVLSDNQAFEMIKNICISRNAAYTIYSVNGGYKDKEIIHTEKTYILEMDRISEETLYEVLEDIKKRLNVGPMLVSKESVELFDY